MDKRHWEHGPCPKHDCRKDSCKCGLRLISFPAALGDDSKGSPVAPKNGDYCNALVKYESNGHMYVYSTEGVPERLSSNGTLNFEELLNRPQYNGEVMTGETDIPEVPLAVSQLTNDLNFQTGGEVNSTVASAVATEATARQQADDALQSAITGVSNALGSEAATRRNADTTLQNNITTVSNNLSSEVGARQNADNSLQSAINGVSGDLSSETAARQDADNSLQSQIDGISASSDVKDIVGTYAELQAYDTSILGDNDIIKVLQDETHSGETTYYRWSTATQTFTLIGEEGPYYTKSATDQLLATKADRATTYTKTETDGLLSGKQGTLTAGSNISISGDTISATDTTFSAGNGLNLTSDGTGENLLHLANSGHYGVSGTVNADGTVTISGTATTTAGESIFRSNQTLEAGTYTMTISKALPFLINFSLASGVSFRLPAGQTSATATLSEKYTGGIVFMAMTAGTTYNETFGIQLVRCTEFSVDVDVVATQGDITSVTSYITDATEYSASATYEVGDYVIHDGDIYQCNITIVGGEAWNASHWDAVSPLQEQLDNTET